MHTVSEYFTSAHSLLLSNGWKKIPKAHNLVDKIWISIKLRCTRPLIRGRTTKYTLHENWVLTVMFTVLLWRFLQNLRYSVWYQIQAFVFNFLNILPKFGKPCWIFMRGTLRKLYAAHFQTCLESFSWSYFEIFCSTWETLFALKIRKIISTL